MPAHEKLNGVQFQYDQPDLGESSVTHRVLAFAGPTGSNVGSMLWNAKGIRNITVAPDQQRRGVATAMWNEGHRLAAESKSVPQPKHSDDRTKAGDAWARSVGGRLPRRRTG
jgi:hypothetical protein